MKLARLLLQASVLLAGSNSACTFYTACPDKPAPNNPAAGGSNGTGGSNGNGGTPDVTTGGEAPRGKWVNETLNLTDFTSECGNVSFMAAKPGEDLLIVSIAQHGLLARASDGDEWLPLGQGQDSAVITNRGSTIVFDPADPNVFWESGIYNEGGVYRTDDAGDTFEDLGLHHNDYVSVDFTDPERKTLLASGHEIPHLLHYSNDKGKTWTDIGATTPDSTNICSWPVVIDASTFLLGCGTFGGGAGGIFRSTDAGESWENVVDHKIFPGPLLASDGTQYWSAEVLEGIVRSDDQGQTFEGPFAKGQLGNVTPVELPDGRIAAAGNRVIAVSDDKGKTWQVVTTAMPFEPTGIVYLPAARAFYAYHWTCENNVPDDAVMSYAFDYEAQ
jgi:hypothetical protein